MRFQREIDNTAWKKKLTPQQKAEYKAEKREEIQNLFKKIDERVKDVFESEKYKTYLRYISKFTDYSARNCMLIMMQKPTASLVAAFGKWKELGRTVNKGEKGIAILAPMTFKSKEILIEYKGKYLFTALPKESEKLEKQLAGIGLNVPLQSISLTNHNEIGYKIDIFAQEHNRYGYIG